MSDRLTISSDPGNQSVLMYYRPPPPPRSRLTPNPIKVLSRPDVAEVVARLAGEGNEIDTPGLSFNYAEAVAMLSAMADAKKLTAVASSGTKVNAAFMLQELPQVRDSIYNAPVIPEGPRPQADEGATPPQVGMAK